jgi:hypothetical protein
MEASQKNLKNGIHASAGKMKVLRNIVTAIPV